MFGLTQLGIVHTLIALIAVGTGAFLLIRQGRISPAGLAGKIYVFATIVACITALAIYQHGGFGKGHVLAILTLVVLGVATAAGRGMFGGVSKAVETVSYSATFLFHWIPGVSEATTRLPLCSPLMNGPEDPALKTILGVLFVLFVVGSVLQVRSLRKS